MTPRVGGLVRQAENPRLAPATGFSKGEAERLTKGATCRTLRRSFAAHWPEAGYKISSVQELRGHSDVLNGGSAGVCSSADWL